MKFSLMVLFRMWAKDVAGKNCNELAAIKYVSSAYTWHKFWKNHISKSILLRMVIFSLLLALYLKNIWPKLQLNISKNHARDGLYTNTVKQTGKYWLCRVSTSQTMSCLDKIWVNCYLLETSSAQSSLLFAYGFII